jgi:uncharacterized protein with von Willebrand factor type A (vWA) domain
VFINFFYKLREANIPVSLREYLMLLEAIDQGLASYDVEHFYYLSRSCLVKDETNFDKFDRVFSKIFKGLEVLEEGNTHEIPEDWLNKLAEKYLSEKEKRKIQSLGGWKKLMETLKERLEEQKKRHQGGTKWIGTAGTSPFGAYGYNPEGIRIGQDENRNNRAVKIWDKREFKNLDDKVELGTRNIKVALRRLRKFAQHGAVTKLDIDDTIRSSAKQGWLDVKMVPERQNAVKILLFLDVGGSMNPHVKLMEELFSAARTEFKHLEYYYFHNCPYERIWKDNNRRHKDVVNTWDILHTYGKDYKVIFVGDASMSPYEIIYPGGSVEHWNEEAGAVWMERCLSTYSKAVWINPVPKKWWGNTQSVRMVSQLMSGRMYPLNLLGLDEAINELSR